MDAEDRTGGGLGEPATCWFEITPHDDENLPILPRAIYVGVAGDVVMRDKRGVTCIFKTMAVGEHPMRPKRILSTGTSATNIIGLY